jgi:peptide/nickel transport system substrate-binding protein
MSTRARKGTALVIAIAACALAACGGSTESAPPASPPPADEPAPAPPASEEPPEETPAAPAGCEGTPTSGGALIVGRQFETTTLNSLELSDNGQIFAQEQIFSTLVRADPNGGEEIVPGLADTWESSPDGLSWTFHIRDNAMFSNGDPVTAEDVKFSLDRFADPEMNTVLPNLAQGYESTEIVDDQTVTVKLSEPVAAFLHNISIFPAFILPAKLVQEQGDAFWENPVGSGAFMVKEWAKSSHITFERNPFYWEEGLPYLDELRYEFVLDDNTRLLKLRANEVGVAEGVPFSQVQALDAEEGIRVQSDIGVRMEPIWINHHNEPFDDLNVRLALSLAIDREAVNEAVYGGLGEVPNHVLPLLVYNSDLPPLAYDPEQAQALLAESKVPDGFSATLQFPAGSAHHAQLVTVLQQRWAAIGVDIELEEVDQSAIADRFFNGDYDLSMPFVQWTSDVIVPDEFAVLFADNTETGLDGFFSGWDNPTIWNMIQEAVVASPDERETLWPTIQEAMVADSPWLNILWLPGVTGIRDDVCDVGVNKLGVYRFERAWLTSES